MIEVEKVKGGYGPVYNKEPEWGTIGYVVNSLVDAVQELQGLISKDVDDKDKGKSGKLMIGNREVQPIDTWSLSVDRAKYYEIVAGFTLTDEEAKVMNDAIHRGEPFVFTLQYFNGVIKKVAKDDNG